MADLSDNEIIEAVERALVQIGVKPTVAWMRKLSAFLDGDGNAQ